MRASRRALSAWAPSLLGLPLRSLAAGASSWPPCHFSSAARMRKPGVAPPRSCCLSRCVPALCQPAPPYACFGCCSVLSKPRTHAAQLLSSLLCSWVAAQIGPVQMRLADALQVFCGAGLASTGIILCIVLGWQGVSNHPYLLKALASSTGGACTLILLLCSLCLRPRAAQTGLKHSWCPFSGCRTCFSCRSGAPRACFVLVNQSTDASLAAAC